MTRVFYRLAIIKMMDKRHSGLEMNYCKSTHQVIEIINYIHTHTYIRFITIQYRYPLALVIIRYKAVGVLRRVGKNAQSH